MRTYDTPSWVMRRIPASSKFPAASEPPPISRHIFGVFGPSIRISGMVAEGAGAALANAAAPATWKMSRLVKSCFIGLNALRRTPASFLPCIARCSRFVRGAGIVVKCMTGILINM